MVPHDSRWVAPLLVALATLVVAVGWLDVVRGRELAIIKANQEWVMREVMRLRDDVEHLKREIRPRRGPG